MHKICIQLPSSQKAGLAPIAYAQRTILDDHGNELPIVNFKLELETPVRDDYYDYFVER